MFSQLKAIFTIKKELWSSLLLLLLVLTSATSPEWGFWAHRRINRLAVYRLPPEMQVFYKKQIDYISENAVNPDRRRYAVNGEAERHFIDMDIYGDSAMQVLPKYWKSAVEKFGEDSLRKHGIAPWYLQTAAFQLTEAFRAKAPLRILRISADIGHYAGDINVPLHTTRNYNGQLTGQEGIHAFWESRLPELYADTYDMWIGEAKYLDNPAETIWKTIENTQAACDSVLTFEKELSAKFDPEKKYTFTERNQILVKTYSDEFSAKYHQLLAGQVERQMKASVRLAGDLWYTCWVNAGQPDLSILDDFELDEDEKRKEAAEQQSWLQRLLRVRAESDSN